MWKRLLYRATSGGKIEALQKAPPVSLALPCIGLDACGHALKELGIPFTVKYAYDIQSCLVGPLTALHRNMDHFHLGRNDGDLLRANIKAWGPVDGIVTGPPCPPWSMIGKRGSWDDPRAAVFHKVTDIIVDQGWKGATFFILEMVAGMDTHTASQSDSSSGDRSRHSLTPFGEWLTQLCNAAPMWHVQVWTGEASSYLPQHRERLYTVGTNKNMGIIPPCVPLIPDPAERVTLAEVLHPGIRPNQEEDLPDRLRWHLFTAKARFLDRARRESLGRPTDHGGRPTDHGGHTHTGQFGSVDVGGCWLVVELDRSPDGIWGVPTRVDGCVPTLRTKHKATWVVRFSSGHTCISRWLHPIEHLTLQGFPPEAGRGLSDSEIIHLAGNACTVPVMAAVLLQVLPQLWQWDRSRPSAASRPSSASQPSFASGTDHGPAPGAEQPPLISASEVLVEQLRAEIAWSQAETQALVTELRLVRQMQWADLDYMRELARRPSQPR